MCYPEAVAEKSAAGAPEVEVTPAMVGAGREEISRRWIEFVHWSGSDELWVEVLTAVFSAMSEARSQ